MQPVNRRRFIRMGGAVAALPLLSPLSVSARDNMRFLHWQGSALGAKAQIMLYTDNAAKGEVIFQKCRLEIDRLENIFSLYRPNSAISRLNGVGHLDNPDLELLELMSRCLACYHHTEGAFDITIQPLWQLYADHFSHVGADPKGPAVDRIQQILKIVGSDKIRLMSRRISFEKVGMGISLNGVAQGYMTDRIAAILKQAGVENALVHMGETYAMGEHQDGRPWTAGISSPLVDHKNLISVSLNHRALATSGGYGSPFSDQSRLHHLLNPLSGKSANFHGSVSVVARDTTTADMLSTAFYVMPIEKIHILWTQYSELEKAIFVDHGGKITEYPAER